MGKIRHQAAVGDFLFGRTRGQILRVLFGRPDKAVYFQELRRQIGQAGIGAVQRELKTLVDWGLVERSKVGNQVFYKANGAHPVFSELRSLLAKTVGIFEQLRGALAPLRGAVWIAFVYGSVARYQETTHSDIDLMIIGDTTVETLLEGLASVEASLGRTINPTVYSRQEFRNKVRSGNHFLNRVLANEKVFLIGDEDELGRLAGSEAAPTRAR